MQLLFNALKGPPRNYILVFFHSHLLFYFLSFSVHINKSSLVMGDVIWCRSPPQSELYASKRGPNLSEIARICHGAKYLGFVSSRSVKTRELSFAQFVDFVRKACLFFNFWRIKFTIFVLTEQEETKTRYFAPRKAVGNPKSPKCSISSCD